MMINCGYTTTFEKKKLPAKFRCQYYNRFPVILKLVTGKMHLSKKKKNTQKKKNIKEYSALKTIIIIFRYDCV